MKHSLVILTLTSLAFSNPVPTYRTNPENRPDPCACDFSCALQVGLECPCEISSKNTCYAQQLARGLSCPPPTLTAQCEQQHHYVLANGPCNERTLNPTNLPCGPGLKCVLSQAGDVYGGGTCQPMKPGSGTGNQEPGKGDGEGEAKGKQGDRCLAHTLIPQPPCGDGLKCVLDDENNPDVGGTCQPDGTTQQTPPIVEPAPGTEGGACGFGARGRGGAIVPCGEGLVCAKGNAEAPGVCEKQRGGQWGGPGAGYGDQNGDGNGDEEAKLGDRCRRQGQDEQGTCATGLVCKVDGTTENGWGICQEGTSGQGPNEGQQAQPGAKGSPCSFTGTPGVQQDICATNLVCGLQDGASPCINPDAGCPGICTEKKDGDGQGQNEQTPTGTKGSPCSFTGTPGVQQDICATNLVCGLQDGASPCINPDAGCPGICTEKKDGDGQGQNEQTPTGTKGSPCSFTGTPGVQQDICATNLVCGLEDGASPCINPDAGCPGVCTEKKGSVAGGYA